MIGGNTQKSKLKRLQGGFPKILPHRKTLEYPDLKRDCKTYIKKKILNWNKTFINNLQDELYSLESKQARGAKICANIRWDLEGVKCSKSFFNILERQHMQN